MQTVDFYYSIGSRYSYLAATQLDTLATETGCHVEWHPINSVQLIAKREVNPFDRQQVLGQYSWDYRELDANRWANFYGVPYQEPRGRIRFDSDLLARACTAAKNFGKVEAFSGLLFAEMFHSAIPQNIDESVCIACAQKCDISDRDFHHFLTSPQTIARLNETIDKAFEIGVFGVPTFVVSGELFWGNDRLVLLDRYLRSR